MKNFPDWSFENNDWQEKTLSEVCSYTTKRGECLRADYVETDNMLKNFDGVNFDSENKNLVRGVMYQVGDVLFSNIRPYLKKVWYADKTGCTNPDVLVIRHNAEIHAKFLYYSIANENFISKVMVGAGGTVMPRGDKKFTMGLKIKIPCVEEQKRIADYFSELDNAIAAQNKKLLNWRELKKGLLQKIFSQEFRFIDDDGNFYPDWQEKTLGEIADFFDSKRKPIEKKERRPGIYPYYGAAGIIDYVEDYIFDEELILLTEDGDPHCFLARGKYWVNNHAHVLKAKAGYENAYICYYLKNMDYRKYIEGTAQPKLNQKNCRQLLLKIPCVEEQKKIADYFTELDKIISAESKILENMRLMKKGLLQKLFV